ncbi:hypothetical protein AKJ16_DCAP17742 [Drosera capensis]
MVHGAAGAGFNSSNFALYMNAGFIFYSPWRYKCYNDGFLLRLIQRCRHTDGYEESLDCYVTQPMRGAGSTSRSYISTFDALFLRMQDPLQFLDVSWACLIDWKPASVISQKIDHGW